MPDAWVIASGEDLSVVFANLKVNLPANGENVDFAGRAQCSIRIPVEVTRGFYISDLEQTFTTTATKSDNSNLSVGATSTFFNLPVEGVNIQAAAGPGTAFVSSKLSATSHDALRVNAFCKSLAAGENSLKGIFRSNVAVSAQRDSELDDAILGTDGTDVRLDIATKWLACP
jgi:hypothetical protein